MKRKMSRLAALSAALLLTASLTACGRAGVGEPAETAVVAETEGQGLSAPEADGEAAAEETDGAAVTGSIQLVGSTSMEELCSILSEAYMEKEPGVTVSNEYVGSTAGIEALLAGTADIGTSSRNLTQEEKDAGAVENVVAMDGITVIVNPDVEGVTELTSAQIADIFTGKITNWSEVGGPDMPIITIGHEAGSGTRDPFEEILGITDECVYANELSGSGPVLAKTAETGGAIGYCSLAIADDSVTRIVIDGMEPTMENVQNGSYTLAKSMVMATRGAIEEQNETVRDFFDFIYSEEGRKLVEQANLIPMS